MGRMLVPKYPIEITLHSYIEPLIKVSSGEKYVAICLELDMLFGAGKSEEEAFLKLRQSISEAIQEKFLKAYKGKKTSSLCHPHHQDYFEKVFSDNPIYYVKNHIERFLTDHRSRVYHLQELCLLDKDTADILSGEIDKRDTE